jgi:DNA-binding transcriptional LysR family regulator
MDATKCAALIAAAETGSFTAAARQLGYTQSGITRMVASLESELGFALCIRTKQGVALTENGRRMLPHLREIVRAERVAEESGAEIRGVVSGTLTVGSYYSISAIWMPEVLSTFEKSYPRIEVALKEGGNQEMGQWLNSRAVDLCFCAKPAQGTYCDWKALYQDEIVMWLPEGHPYAAASSYPIRELEHEAFIHTLADHDTDQDRLIREEKLHLEDRYETSDGFTTYNMVEAGLGVSFNQRLISRKWQGRVKEVPFEEPHYISLGIAVPSLAEASPAAKRFIACIEGLMPRLAAQAQGRA